MKKGGLDDMITLVIHTPERAGMLKNILENHGITVFLEDFVVSNSTLRVAERVKIYPEDLPHALKILESGDNYSAASITMKMAGMSGNLLIPVDFSDSSLLAVRVGFGIASRLGVHPVLMHSYVAPLFAPGGIADGDVSADPSIEEENEVIESETIRDIRAEASRKFDEFKERINKAIKSGDVNDMNYSTTLLEGVPEEMILNYCKETPPMLVVMATRGVERKEEELIGSVTAEVLDSCRVPVLTVPDNHFDINLGEIRRLMVFCNVDQHDVLAVDTLMRMFDFPGVEITLVPVQEKKRYRMAGKIHDLCQFFRDNYPSSSFKVFIPKDSDFRRAIDQVLTDDSIQMIIVPNKKTNIFSRIFHPTIAHRFLFERYMPMLALPV